MVMVGVLACLSGCAKDRNIDDYHRDQVEQEISEMNGVSGVYRGTFTGQDGTVIGGLAVNVSPDRSSVANQNGPISGQSAVLQVSVSLSGGSETKYLTFNGSSYDHAAMQFAGEATVANRGNAEIQGTFNGNTLTGTLKDGDFPDRGGSFTVVKDAAMPSFAGRQVRAATEDAFLYQTFSGMGKFRKPGKNPNDDFLTIRIMHQVSVAEQDLMDIITPYRYVDVSVYHIVTEPDGSSHPTGGTFSNAIWSVRDGTLRGSYTAAATQNMAAVETTLYCNQAGPGWSCEEDTLSDGKVFSVMATPAQGDGQ
jgi:hypothetical protein